MKANQIKFGAILSYCSIAINILAGLLYTPWMIEQIGKSEYGLYTLANSLITLFLVDFGLSAATARYTSKYVAEGKQDAANDFLGAIYKLYLIIDAFIFFVLIIIYFSIDIIYVKLTPTEIEKFKVVYGIVSVYAVVNFPFVTLNGILTAYEKFIQLKFADIIQRALTIVLTIIALLCGFGLYALVAVNAVTGIIVIIYKYIVISKTTSVKIKFTKTDKSLYIEIFKFSFWATISTIALRLVFNITPTILGIVASSEAIAIFGVVTTIEAYTYMLTTAVNGMFMPKISRIYASGEDENLMPLMTKVGRFQFSLNSLMVIGFALAGKDFIILWMGEEFVEAYIGILFVIIPGVFFNSLQIANTAMIVKNKVKEQAIINLVVGFFNIICSFVLSKHFGVLGACFSIFLAYSLRALLYHIVHKKIMKLDIKKFINQCYFKMLPSVVITVLFGVIVNYIFSITSWLSLVCKAMVIVVIFIFSVVACSLNKREKQYLISSFMNVKNKIQFKLK